MNKLGVHALVWVGGWSEAECSKAIRSTAELGYDYIEIPLLNPYGFPTEFTRARLDEHKLGATASLGLSAATDISSEDPDTVKRGEDLLDTAVSVVRDLGATPFLRRDLLCPAEVLAAAGPSRRRQRGRGDGPHLREGAGVGHHGRHRGRQPLRDQHRQHRGRGRGTPRSRRRLQRLRASGHLPHEHRGGLRRPGDRGLRRQLGYFHIGESHRGYLGTGTVDFDRVFRSLARIGYRARSRSSSFSSAVVDPVLSNMLGVWRNLWSDGQDLARHAKAFIEAQLVAAEARDRRVTFLGIDVGTSAVKAVLVDADQHLLASRRGAAGDLAAASALVGAGARRLVGRGAPALAACARQRPATWRASPRIGLSGQMHGAVAAGRRRPAAAAGDPVERRPGRAGGATARAGAHPGLAALVGVAPMPGFTGAQDPWLARHEPDVLARMRTVLLPKDYVRLKLTGERATDMSDAAGTWWLDQAPAAMVAGSAAATGLRDSALPRLVEGSEPAGALRADCARDWGLPAGIVVAGGGGDAAAGAVGIGAIGDGDAFLSLGTSAQLFVARPAYRPAPERRPRVLPRSARPLVPDGRDAERGLLPRLGVRSSAVGIPALLARAEARGPARRLDLPALSRGRAHAAQRSSKTEPNQ